MTQGEGGHPGQLPDFDLLSSCKVVITLSCAFQLYFGMACGSVKTVVEAYGGCNRVLGTFTGHSENIYLLLAKH